MIETITISPPEIRFKFNKYLLMTYLERVDLRCQELQAKAIKKFRKCLGKQREFNDLLTRFKEMYERKKKEEDEYREKIKAKTKRSLPSNSGTTCTFRRMES